MTLLFILPIRLIIENIVSCNLLTERFSANENWRTLVTNCTFGNTVGLKGALLPPILKRSGLMVNTCFLFRDKFATTDIYLG